jgi:hypothetical protein
VTRTDLPLRYPLRTVPAEPAVTKRADVYDANGVHVGTFDAWRARQIVARGGEDTPSPLG